MILFNIIEMGKQLFFEQPVEASVREVLAKEMIDLAVEVINYPHTENTVIGNLIENWENNYQVMGIDGQMQSLVNTIRKGIKSSGWDSRCLAKVEYKGPGQSFLMARVVMDLEETFAKLHESILTTTDTNIVEVVSDNPDMDTLNALAKTNDRQVSRNLQILSSRSATYLRNNKERDWGVRDREGTRLWDV